MASNIYDQHCKAFERVAAYVIMEGKSRQANIAFKFPKDGAGRLWVYVHWFGVPMVRGFAGGYGYDKRSAACAVAADVIGLDVLMIDNYGDRLSLARFKEALMKDDGYGWDANLRQAGFEVYQAV